MQIVDLRQLTSRQLDPLLAEEAQQWRKELLWDYRASIDLIKKFVDGRSLTGSAVIEDDQPVGYAFYVLEEHKGLVGGLFVSPRYAQQDLSQRLLADTLTTLGGIPKLDRVEAQLIPFGYTLDPVLSEYGFRLYMRQFMLASLSQKEGTVFDVLPGLIREGPGAGLILGLLVAFAAMRVLGSLLFGVSAHDPLTFVAVSLALALAAVLACYIPARRATKVDPIIALRYE